MPLTPAPPPSGPNVTAPAASTAPSASAAAAAAPPVAPLDLPTQSDLPASEHSEQSDIASRAEHAGSQPASATDSLFAFAKPYLDQARPYVDRAAAEIKPYTDAAMEKGKELKERIEATATTPLNPTDPNDPNARAAASGTAASPTAGVQEKAKNAFGFGLASLQSAYNQVGAAIDAKTATPDKPGLFTQVSSAVQKGVQQINQAVVEPLNPNATSASPYHAPDAPAGSAVPSSATNTTAAATSSTAAATTTPLPTATSTGGATAQHPIVTTTNTVPHNDEAGDEALV